MGELLWFLEAVARAVMAVFLRRVSPGAQADLPVAGGFAFSLGLIHMQLGQRDVIACGGMAVAWRRAAEDLGIRFVSPFVMGLDGVNYWCSGWLPDFGCPRGTVIADRYCVDEIFDVTDALGYYASGLNPRYYETYCREQFVETLSDWGWFGRSEDAPSWLADGVEKHGGADDA